MVDGEVLKNMGHLLLWNGQVFDVFCFEMSSCVQIFLVLVKNLIIKLMESDFVF